MFPHCEIACHHDFLQEPGLDRNKFSGVQFVDDFVPTFWGHTSLIEAGIKALRLLCDRPHPPDWFYLLSGADYPIQPARVILQDLQDSIFNVFATYGRIAVTTTNNKWQDLRRQRYHGNAAPTFPHGFDCFAGEHWFTADLRAIRILLETSENQPRLLEHYKGREQLMKGILPEESYYQTVFCNTASIRVKDDCLRYIDWHRGGPHPKTLTVEDIPEIIRSKAHFARKFEFDQHCKILDMLDDTCHSRL